jgi:hypothetical protein
MYLKRAINTYTPLRLLKHGQGQWVDRDSVVGRSVRSKDLIPVRARFSTPLHTGPEGPPSLQYNEYCGKEAGAWRWPSTLSSAGVK